VALLSEDDLTGLLPDHTAVLAALLYSGWLSGFNHTRSFWAQPRTGTARQPPS